MPTKNPCKGLKGIELKRCAKRKYRGKKFIKSQLAEEILTSTIMYSDSLSKGEIVDVLMDIKSEYSG